MSEGLYGLDALLDGLVPRLIGLRRRGERRVGREYPGGGPVVQVIGGRASGKTVLIDALYDGYKDWIPLARVDLAKPEFGEEALNASPVTNLLYKLSYDLGKETSASKRRLRFPCLALGLLVITAWRPDGPGGTPGNTPGDVRPAHLREAENRLREHVGRDDPDQQRRKELLRQWLDALAQCLAAVFPGLPGLDSILTTASGQLLAPRADKGALRWWRRHVTWHDGDAVQRLFDFARDFRQRGGSRSKAEALLVTALLADIDHHYGLVSRWNRVHPPLILLDNVHALESRFLDPLLAAYATMAGPAGTSSKVTRPVVIATSLGGSDGDGITALPDVAHATPWRCRGAQLPRRWLLRLGIPPASSADIEHMLRSVSYPDDLPLLIERISGGRTGNAVVMAKAAVYRARTDRGLRTEELLSLPSPEREPSVAEHLLEQLLPDQGIRNDLVLLSAALDEAAARGLWHTLRPEDSPVVRVRKVKDLVDQGHWHPRPWRGAGDGMPLVKDRALRAVLLHQLRAGCDDERWSQTHRSLRSRYNPQDLGTYATGHTIPYLHHTLALGELDHIVLRCMHHRFTEAESRDWLSAVNVICAAPRPREGFAVAPPAHAPPCRACANGEDADAVHSAISRLMHIVWRQSDPIAGVPRHRDVGIVQRALETLGDEYQKRQPDDENNAYIDAWQQWPAALQQGVQAPDLPIPEGD